MYQGVDLLKEEVIKATQQLADGKSAGNVLKCGKESIQLDLTLF